MNYETTFLSVLWGLAAAGIALHLANLGQQITYITLADGRKQERKLPLLFRVFIPLTPNVTPLLEKKVFTKFRENAESKITSAGFEGLLSGEEFMALRLILPICLGFLWWNFVLLAVKGAPSTFLESNQFFFYTFGPIWFFYYPAIWLKKSLAIRHRHIQRELPFALDLLTLSVEAGMDFMTALNRYTERNKIDPLTEELIRVVREIQIGKTRRESLRGMSKRVNLAELRSVVNSLIQADELGVSIGAILRIQADQMRQRRFERAEKLANEAPVKMLGPLLFFIFPSVFLILLAPILTKFFEQM